MPQCYQAIYNQGQVEWLDSASNSPRSRIMIMTGSDEELAEFYNAINALIFPAGVSVFSLLRILSPEQLLDLAKNHGNTVDWQELQLQANMDNGI